MPLIRYQNPALKELVGVNLLPVWDEKLLIAFNSPQDMTGRQSLNPNRAVAPYSSRQLRKGNVDIDDSMLLVKECLRDFQAYFLLNDSGDPFRVSFPYARYIAEGDKIDNLTTGDQYTIVKIYNEKKHDVLLSGKRKPSASDRLRLQPDNEVFFNHGYPRVFSKGHKFSEEGSVGDKPAPWNDTITYIVTRSSPGSIDSAPPFQGTRQVKPQFRESVINNLDPVLLTESTGWMFDNLAQFDCWAQNNGDAVSLIKWFEDFVLKHTWILELYGVTRVLYWQRDEDAEVASWRTDITKRTVIYYFRTEKISVYQSRRLSHIKVTLDVEFTDDPIPNEYEFTVPPPSTATDWPLPTSSIDVTINDPS